MQMNHFKSIKQEDQRILSRCTLPTSVEDIYVSCDNPPTINTYQMYRDDTNEGLKFYSDPVIYGLRMRRKNTKMLVNIIGINVIIN